jgi:uncharacterized membrane protein
MRRPEWLTRESEHWEADGVISPEQRRAILDRYPDTPEKDQQLTARTLVWLAWLVAGFALILLVTWNWTSIPPGVKVTGASLVTLALYAAAWRKSRRGANGASEWLAFGAAIACGAVAAAVAEWRHLLPSNTLPLLFWALAIAVTAFVVASPITTALGAGVLAFWALTDAGRPPPPWSFMFVFPFLAAALERRSHPYAAGVVTLALGLWVPLVGLDTWRQSVVPGAMLLAAGGALDAWAHQRDGRRPAFARATPALALVVVGLVFLGAAALHRASLPALTTSSPQALQALTLFGALTMVSMWPSQAQRAAHWRPMVFGGLGVVWWVSTALASGQTQAPLWWAWMWTILPSVALVVLTISAVRESTTTRNRGLFLVGVAAMVALVVMHFTGGDTSVVRSSVVLFAAAGVLWWVSRPDV